jgi:hypothetical protein
VHDARLDDGLREHRFDRLGEAFQAVAAGDEDVLDAAVFQLGDDFEPKLRAFVLLEPE